MKAIIMAGGRGTRLGPYAAILPKPLMPLGDEMPVLELLLRQLKTAGVVEVVLAVNHLHHLLRAYFGDGETLGIKIRYSLEDKPLGTAGPIAKIIENLDDDFVVANGDLLTTLDVAEMIREHVKCSADVTVASHRRQLKSDFGLLDVDDRMMLTAYREKPIYEHLVSMGLYVMRRSAVTDHLVPDAYLDIPDLLRKIIGSDGRVYCHAPECFWLDIGRPDDYARAQEVFAQQRSSFLKDEA
jgi:NDP-mannose synthase